MTVIACIVTIISLLITSFLVGFPIGSWPLGLACVIAFGYWMSTLDDDDTAGGPAILISTITFAVITVVCNVYLDRKAEDEKTNISVQCQDGIYWPK